MINKYQEGGYMSEFAPVPAYQPDYKFLVSALQVQENEYQRGLSTVRNVYSSLLNKDVTSSDNQTYRNEIFKKLQTSLKDISAIDFSNPVNISRAQSLLEPITSDQQLMYDMQVSQFHKGEKQRLESVRNSTDEKVRSTYNPMSLQAISLVEDELRNAKRGENSITNIRPQKFVAFQDPIKDLDALAKESNLEIEIDNTDGKSGYIVKTTNGAMTIPQFTNWAKARLGAKYDEQFAQEAFVKTESQIRNVMQQQNISKQQATKLVATELGQNLYNQTLEELQASDATLKKINEEIDTFEDNHPDGGKTPKLKEQYQNLLADREKATNELALKSGIDEKFKNEGIEYISQNLNSIVSNSLKSNAAKSWASTYAMAKMKYELRPDQVVLEKWKLAQDERQHAQDLAFRQQQAANENAWKQKNYELEVAKMNQATAIAQAEGKLPSTSRIKDFTDNQAKSTGVDILQESLQQNKDQLFNLAFGAQNGLINAITSIGGENHKQFYPALANVKAIVDRGAGKLSEADKKQIVILANNLGLDPKKVVSVDDSPANAQSLLNNLAGAVYNKAKDHVGYNIKQGKIDKVAGMADVFTKTLASMTSMMSQRENLNSNYKRLAKEIAPGGQVKSMYQGVKVMYYLNDGTPVFDVTGLEASKKAHLQNIIDASYTKRTGAIGGSYQMNVLSDAEVTLLTSPGFVADIEDPDGEDESNFTVQKLNNLSIDAKRKLFSNGVIGSFDPGSKNAYFELKVDPSTSIAKELGIKSTKTLKLKVPYSTLMSSSNQQSLPRIRQLVAANQQNFTSAGLLEPLLNNFTKTVEAPSYYESYGFDFAVTGTYDHTGKPGLNVQLAWTNPETNKKESKTSFFGVNDINNPANFITANDYINNSFQKYLYQRQTFEKNQ
jgi:uncharacterized protein YoaH (UPF0181 family)